MTVPTLNDKDPDEHDQGLCPYPFLVSLDRFNKDCNTFDNLSSRIRVKCIIIIFRTIF